MTRSWIRSERPLAACLLGALALVPCLLAAAPVDNVALDLSVPAPPGSGMYTLASAAGDAAYLSWIEPAAAGHVLKFARLRDKTWGPAQEIARGDNWFVNWADKPAIVELADGKLMAHWLVNTPSKGAAHYAYGLQVALSSDRGTTWRPVFDAGMDNTADYSGFMAFQAGAREVLATYLTPLARGASQADAGHIKTLRVARFDLAGRLRSDGQVDADVCTCCPLSMVETDAGPVIAYRDHRGGEVRDISVVRFVDGAWTEPSSVHRDGWVIAGCPTNGPAMAARGRRVAVAWFTAADDRPHVRLAFSDDAGAKFAAPATVDHGSPVGWPAVVLLDDGSAAVSWLERQASGAGELRVRAIGPSGNVGDSLLVATTASGRATGMPQMVRRGQELIVAWRQDDRLRSAAIPLGALRSAGSQRRQ